MQVKSWAREPLATVCRSKQLQEVNEGSRFAIRSICYGQSASCISLQAQVPPQGEATGAGLCPTAAFRLMQLAGLLPWGAVAARAGTAARGGTAA